MARAFSVVSRVVALSALLLAAVGCSDQADRRPPAGDVLGREKAPFVAAQSEPAGYALTTLPTSGVVVTGRTGAICYSHEGEEQWRFEVAPGDEIVAAPAVAPDSSVYLLTSREVVALSADGRVQWRFTPEPAAMPVVLALGDGSAVIMSGNDQLVSVAGGGERWRFRLPDGDTIVSLPRVAGNSRIFVQGAARLYVVDMTGVPVWDVPL